LGAFNMMNHSYGHRRQRGIALIWTALVLMVMILMVGLAIDTVYVVHSAQQLQVGADAAALGGALHVRRNHNDARASAIQVASLNTAAAAAIQLANNPGNAAGGDVVIGHYNRQNGSFTTNPSGSLMPNAFRARARRTAAAPGGPLDTLFAAMVGINTWEVQREATAIVIGDIGPAVLALDEGAPDSLHLGGAPAGLIVSDGAVYINGGASNNGPPTLSAPETYVAGDLAGSWGQVRLDGELIEVDEPYPDPLALLPEPNRPTDPDVQYGNRTLSGNVTLQPGVYNNITINGAQTQVTFEPGLYYITGTFTHNVGTINATEGVMFFFAGPNGRFDRAGNGTLRIVGMDPTQYPEGPNVPPELAHIKVPIFQARNNTQIMRLRGTNNSLIDGTVYVPGAILDAAGTPNPLANGLIAGKIHVQGNTQVIIDYQDQFPRIPRRVFLVE